MSRQIIRLLETWEEFRSCERLQKTVWGTLAVSSEVLTVTAKHGGVVLGAFLNGRLVGFIYAFLARRKGELIHWSHMMAVEPRCRDHGLGFRMKLAHRQLALEQRLKAICWTYDPLQSRNATLNIARLGGRVDEYLPDCYGHFPSKIERGIESDRFVVDWRIASASVKQRLTRRGRSGTEPIAVGSTALVNWTRKGAKGFIENVAITLDRSERRLLVEVPCNTDLMRSRALSLARRWRLEMRRVFEHYLGRGYRVEDFLPPSGTGEGGCFYLLRKG